MEMEAALDASRIAVIVPYQFDYDPLDAFYRDKQAKKERWAQRVDVVKQASCVSVDVYVEILVWH